MGPHAHRPRVVRAGPRLKLGKPLSLHGAGAAIAAQYARAPRFEDTDWEAILALYDALSQLDAVTRGAAERAAAAGGCDTAHVDGPQAAPRRGGRPARRPLCLARYHLLGAVRGDQAGPPLGRHAEAAEELERSGELAPTRHERTLLLEREGGRGRRMIGDQYAGVSKTFRRLRPRNEGARRPWGRRKVTP